MLTLLGFFILMIPLILIIRFMFRISKNTPASTAHTPKKVQSQKPVTYTTPGKDTWRLFTDMLSQPNLLVAGCQGSGKSVAINGLINTLLQRLPFDRSYPGNNPGAQMILIDPKRVELTAYSHLPHTLCHASGFSPEAWVTALRKAVSIMDNRYSYMERNRLKDYDQGDLYVIIDEWANVYENGGKEAYKLVLRLISEGRAAHVHLIMATQVPTAKVIPTTIRENFDARLCLRTVNATQSRVIMGEDGCEDLPRPKDVGYAHGFYFHGGESKKYELPYIQEDEINSNIAWWENQMRLNDLAS